jgi:hypothetical protein
VARALFKSGPVKIVPAFPGVLMLLPSLAHLLDRGNYVIDLEGLLLTLNGHGRSKSWTMP